MEPEQTQHRRPIRSRSHPVFQSMARGIAQLGISPNMISVLGMIAALASGACLACSSLMPHWSSVLLAVAGLLIPLRLLANMLDGLVAVECRKQSATGDLFNEVPDRISDTAIIIGAGYAIMSSSTLGYMAAIAALFVTYIRVLGRSLGAPSDFRGPMAKQQRMVIIAAAAFWLAAVPDRGTLSVGHLDLGIMAATLWVVIIGSVVTAARRLHTLTGILKNRRGGEA